MDKSTVKPFSIAGYLGGFDPEPGTTDNINPTVFTFAKDNLNLTWG